MEYKIKRRGQTDLRTAGGSADPIPAYASTGERQGSEQRLDYLHDRVAGGFEAVKLQCHGDDMDDDLAVARAVRAEYPDLTLMIDLNMGWSVSHPGGGTRTFEDALSVARELEELGNVGWLEEPLDQLDYDTLTRLRAQTDIAIAGGEFNNGLHQFVDHRVPDVLQPDVMLSAGILKTKLIAGLAELHGLQFAPHTWNDGIGFAANLQVLACTNPSWYEYPIEPPGWSVTTRDFLLADPLTADNGAVRPPTDPGLGINLDWDLVDELAATGV